MIREVPLLNHQNNRLVLSDLTEYNGIHQFKNFLSVKFVFSGTECYGINNKCYDVPGHSFLLTDCNEPYEIFVKSTSNVKGMCLFFPYTFITDVYQNLFQNEDFLLDYPFEDHPAFCKTEQIFPVKGNMSGNSLLSLYQKAHEENFETVDSSPYFFSMCIHLFFNGGQLNKKRPNQTIRKSTAHEILCRVMKAKEQLDNDPGRHWQMNELSRSVGLSEFHFFRSFKKAFHITPYQYLLEKRMQLADRILDLREHKISEVAYLCGFADIHSFSKIFKRYRGVSPSLK